MRVYSIEINNLSTGKMCGQYIKQGSLNLVVDCVPSPVYRRYGNVLISNTGGIWQHFTMKPGTERGFAGREITLSIAGIGKVFKNKGLTKVTFKGDLWDTGEGYAKCVELAGCQLVNIAMRSANARHKCYCGGYLMSAEQLAEKLGHLINFTPATMNKEIIFE